MTKELDIKEIYAILQTDPAGKYLPNVTKKNVGELKLMAQTKGNYELERRLATWK
jgi:hypothetical protein